MKKSKLFQLLGSFDKHELDQFDLYVQSPFFNKRPELHKLFLHLKDLFSVNPGITPDKATLWSCLYPDEIFDGKKLAYQMNYLLKLAESYLGTCFHQNIPFQHQLDILGGLAEKKLDKHYHFNKQQITTDLLGQDIKADDYFYAFYRLKTIGNDHFLKKNIRQFDQQIQEANDYLDQFYLTQKLRVLSEMIDRQRMFTSTYQLHFLEKTLARCEASLPALVPIQKAYYLIIKMWTDTDGDPFFHQLRTQFDQEFHQLSFKDKNHILSHALNYCIQQIRTNENRQFFLEEALSLYVLGIDKKIYLHEDKLSPWHFKNIIKLAFGVKKFDWAEEFIQHYSVMLDEKERENALHYNLADLYYQKKDYQQAMVFLNQVAFTDIHYQLSSKILLLKIFYELDEEEALLSLLASFIMLLKRNKNISINLRKGYLNFCQLLNKIMRRNIKKLLSIQTEIQQTSPVVEREWLLNTLQKESQALGLQLAS